MKNYKKTITMLLTAAVLLIAVLMTGCTKLSEVPNSTPSEVDAPAESDGFGVYVKLERDDASSIALHGGSFTKVCENADGSLLKAGEWIFTGDDIAPIRNLFNEWYARDISKKRRISNKIKGNAGEPMGQPPYGYIKDPNDPKHWIVDDEAAQVVRRVYSMTLEGFGTEQIATQLEKDGVLTPRAYWLTKGIKRPGKGKQQPPTKWNSSTITKILSLQEYCGDILNFKTYSKSYKNKKRIDNDRENWVVFQDVHEAIIERAVYEQVQQKRGKIRKRRTNNGEHNIKPHIGSIPLSKLTTLDLQKLYKKLMKAGRVERIESKKQPKGLSAKTVRNLNQIISSAMDMAIEQKLISVNPTNKCALPKIEHREMNTLTQDQLAAFLAEARRSGVYEMYYTELATGLRRGELLGLKWGDIDFKDNLIRIRRQVARIDGNVVEAPLKTKNAYRCVAITQDVAAMLRQKKVDDNGRSEYVFGSETGGPISPDSVLNMLHRVLDRAGLPRLRFHDLRHTFATLALQNGVDIKTVSGMLGHYSAGFTLDTYTHVTTLAQTKAAETMGGLLANAVK